MLTIDRLVDGINGEDPRGARLYMSQLRENEVRVVGSPWAARIRRFKMMRRCANLRLQMFSAGSSISPPSLPPTWPRGWSLLIQLHLLLRVAQLLATDLAGEPIARGQHRCHALARCPFPRAARSAAPQHERTLLVPKCALSLV